MTTPQDPSEPYDAPSQPPPYVGGQQEAGTSPAPVAGQPQYPATGQNDTMSQYAARPGASYASWLQRVGATLLDGLIGGVPFFVLLLIGGAIGHGVGTLVAIVAYLGGLAFWLWNVVFRQGTTGQTLAKGWLGIRLIRESDGQPVGPGMSFVRQIAHVLDSISCYVGYLWPLWDAKRQTFADKVCSTVVVQI